MALIIPGGYCSCVALCSWHVQSPGTSHRNNHISISPPPVRKDGTPLCQVRLIGRWKKRRVAQSGNLHRCSSHYKFVSSDLGTQVPSISINSQPIPFPAPLAGSYFKSLLNRLHSSCRDVSEQGLQGSPVRELVTGDPMACSIAGWPHNHPSGVIACCQIWQLSPRLEHGRVESIDQLARYHTQIDTPTEWRHQFCSGETRLDRYGVYPKWLTLWFGKPKKQSCSVEYLSFLFHVVLELIRWYPICHAFNHHMEGISPPVFQFPPLTSEGV